MNGRIERIAMDEACLQTADKQGQKRFVEGFLRAIEMLTYDQVLQSQAKMMTYIPAAKEPSESVYTETTKGETLASQVKESLAVLKDVPQVLVVAIGSASLRDVEGQVIRHTLLYTHHHKGNAAKILGIDRKTLYRKMREYGIAIDESTSSDGAKLSS